MAARLASALAILALAAPAIAQPFGDVELSVEDETIVVGRRAAPSERVGTMRGRRLSSRRAAEAAARADLHRFVDDALARVLAQPDVATRAHRVVDGDAVQVRVRPLVDGSSVVELRLPLAALRAVAALEGVPW
jgi:hypothetical protein